MQIETYNEFRLFGYRPTHTHYFEQLHNGDIARNSAFARLSHIKAMLALCDVQDVCNTEAKPMIAQIVPKPKVQPQHKAVLRSMQELKQLQHKPRERP